MKRKFTLIVIALMAVAGLSASAQVKVNGRPMPGDQNKMYKPVEYTEMAFEGILLDINQQERIDSLNAAVRSTAQVAKHEMRRPDMRKNKEKCDSTISAPQPRQHHQMISRNGILPGIQYVAKVKEILTPEQFEVFMTNVANLPDNAPVALREGAPVKVCKGNMGGDCQKCEGKAQGKDCKKADCKKADCKKADCKKADCKKADCKKADCKKADCKKGDCKKGDCKDCKK